MSESFVSLQTEQQAHRHGRSLMIGLLTTALLLRLTAAVLVDRQAHAMGQSFLIEGDANGYWELGRRIASGEDYSLYFPPRQVLRVPGFPLLLAASIRVFGDDVLKTRFVLAVVGMACCLLTWRLGAMLHSERVGFWAALFVAVNPLHVGNCVLMLSETWFTLWMLLSLLGLVSLVNGSQTGDSIVVPCRWRLLRKGVFVGGLMGATTLVRPGFLPWVAISALAVILFLKLPRASTCGAAQRIPLATRCLAASGLILGCVLVMLPWAARNATVTGHWVWTSLWSGPSLYDGLNPQATGASNMRFFEDDFVMQRMTEFEMNQHYKQKAIDFAIQNPSTTVQLACKKAALFLMPIPNFAKEKPWAVQATCVVSWLVLVGTILAGLLSRQWDLFGLLVMAGPLLMFLMVHMVFVGSVRYRLPLEIPVSVLAAIGWHSWVCQIAFRSAKGDA